MFFWQKKYQGNIGKQGEMLAERFLRSLGYQILARNSFNTRGIRLGELDIVARDGEEIVFVEVKASLSKPGIELHPELRVDRHKLQRLERAAGLWLRKERLEEVSYRFDVVALVLDSSGEVVSLKHFDNVFL